VCDYIAPSAPEPLNTPKNHTRIDTKSSSLTSQAAKNPKSRRRLLNFG
jgi:hypothetical protein